ncbi:Translin [Saitoella complicata NRRL Y-17804]|nr:Translin [Saitoella complicata NRRL Y-17804]ODQ50855.1 Translin [Saitoella complicata NRRL Y-17804]
MAEIDMTHEATPLVDPEIFVRVQQSIDEDALVRESLRATIKELERYTRTILAILARSHSTSSAQLPSVLKSTGKHFNDLRTALKQLSDVASEHPYYKYNGMWTNQLQQASYCAVLYAWLGGSISESVAQEGRLLSIEEVGQVLDVPVNVADKDIFHLTIEEYLHSLVSLINELSRLAINSVTLGIYQRPLLISRFVKDLFAAFQVLNLKNDSLRRRFDSIKYDVKKVEEVVYDLSLRGKIDPSSN